MNIAIIIPTRNDRPDFEANCLRMIKNQTIKIKPENIILVNDEPLNFNGDGYLEPDKNPKCDITWRYRIGYDRLRNKNITCILFMENDDWYAPNYIETMYNKWMEVGKPDLLGCNYTIYYHLKLKSWFQFNHSTRASAMNTLIKPDLNFNWCPDHEAYTDMHLWTVVPGLTKHTFAPGKHICMGMKHGVGLCGGNQHTTRLDRFKDPKTSFQDPNSDFLKKYLDSESFNFFSNYFNDGKIL